MALRRAIVKYFLLGYVSRKSHARKPHSPTDMNGQFTYGSQLSSNRLAVDSYKSLLLGPGLGWTVLCATGSK
eukprot:8853412-Ditylum_brightwellii.AAC.1